MSDSSDVEAAHARCARIVAERRVESSRSVESEPVRERDGAVGARESPAGRAAAGRQDSAGRVPR